MEWLSDQLGSPHGIWVLNLAVALYITGAAIWGYDQYPFNFLTLVLSIMALQFTMIVLVVQNRQSAIDQRHAEQERRDVATDLEWNEKAFDMLADLHKHLVPEETTAERATKPDEPG